MAKKKQSTAAEMAEPSGTPTDPTPLPAEPKVEEDDDDDIPFNDPLLAVGRAYLKKEYTRMRSMWAEMKVNFMAYRDAYPVAIDKTTSTFNLSLTAGPDTTDNENTENIQPKTSRQPRAVALLHLEADFHSLKKSMNKYELGIRAVAVECYEVQLMDWSKSHFYDCLSYEEFTDKLKMMKRLILKDEAKFEKEAGRKSRLTGIWDEIVRRHGFVRAMIAEAEAEEQP